MIIALCSMKFKNNNLELNKNKIINAIQTTDPSVDLLCFGEAFLQGFDCLTWDYVEDKKIAIRQKSNVIFEIANIAKENKKAVAFGYIEIVNSNIFSSYIVISKTGEILCNFRRVSKGWKVNSADNCYSEGSEFYSFIIDNLSFSTSLDIE